MWPHRAISYAATDTLSLQCYWVGSKGIQVCRSRCPVTAGNTDSVAVGLSGVSITGESSELEAKLRGMMGSDELWQNEENLAHDVNGVLRYWTNYVSYGTFGTRTTSCGGSWKGGSAVGRSTYDTLGIIDATRVLGTSRGPSGETWFESRTRDIGTSSSMSGEGRRDHGSRAEAHGAVSVGPRLSGSCGCSS